VLESIVIRNLGCFDDYDYKIKFNRLTVIVGTNNSGKSTIFKGLDAFLRYGNNRYRWTDSYFHRKGTDIIYGNSISKYIKLGATINSKESYVEISNEVVKSFVGMIHDNISSKIQYIPPKRSSIEYDIGVTSTNGTIAPNGNNIINFLIERWTSQDKNWSLFVKWIKKIDPQIQNLTTPLNGNNIQISTERYDGNAKLPINLNLQGDGIQNALIIIVNIIFSDNKDTILIEKPETHLHPKSIEVLVDLFNYAVNHLNKQIIIVTHSWDILRAYYSDVGAGSPRGNQHDRIKSEDFKLVTINNNLGESKIQEYDISNKKFTDVINHFKELWG